MIEAKLVYGSDTGNTDEIVNTFVTDLFKDSFNLEIVEVGNLTSEDWTSHTLYLLGIPTWYDGELQSDWEDYFEEFKTIDFTGKTVAVFGLGEQLGYGEWFCDGIGILAEVVIKNGGTAIGLTKKDTSFEFENSKALKDEDTFWGLCLDEDNQSELTEDRLKDWYIQLKEELTIQL